MSGISVGGAPPFVRAHGDELRGVLRGVLLSAQHLLRERFEKRVAWVDGHWEWRREAAGPAAPLPPEARQKVADVSRLFEILTNAQFRDQGPGAKTSFAAPEFVPLERLAAGAGAGSGAAAGPREAGGDGPFLACALLVLGALTVWAAALLLCRSPGARRRAAQLKQRMKGWFTTKAAAAEGEIEAEQTPPRDDPPPPYTDGSAEPFLSPGGGAGAAGAAGAGDLPPPYSSCEASGCKGAASDQLQSLAGAGPGSPAPDARAVQAGKTEDENCSKPDSKAVPCDSSLVVVV